MMTELGFADNGDAEFSWIRSVYNWFEKVGVECGIAVVGVTYHAYHAKVQDRPLERLYL